MSASTTHQLCSASRWQGDNEFDVVPGSDLVVARTAHRDNKSDYYVDGRKSSFGAVTTLLKGKGIDLDNNRFLILQVSAVLRGTARTTAALSGQAPCTSVLACRRRRQPPDANMSDVDMCVLCCNAPPASLEQLGGPFTMSSSQARPCRALLDTRRSPALCARRREKQR